MASDLADHTDIDCDSFPQLPDSLASAHCWKRVVVGAWRDQAHITPKEARAALLGIRHATDSQRNSGSACLPSGDNLSESVAFGKARARDKTLSTSYRRT